MRKKEKETCIYFKGFEDCHCNNHPDDPGECVYEKGIEPKNPALRCPHYKSLGKAKLDEINQRENKLIRSFYGRVPEANTELNDMQREKIRTVYENFGTAFIGKITYNGSERGILSTDTVFTEYTGQLIYNFGADFVVPAVDDILAEMIVEWNKGGKPMMTRLFKRIYNMVEALGGANLLWS